jgi:site-specific DNA recombinase
MNVIGYARVSTSDQKENGHSLQYQEDAIVKYCKSKGYNLIEVHKEDHTGKDDFNRPKWNQITNYIKKNKNAVQGIVCLRWDRYSRNVVEALMTMNDLKKKGVSIITIEETINYDDPADKLRLHISLSFAEMESNKNSKRTTESTRRCRLDGCWTGCAPFGYLNHRDALNRSTLKPHPENSKIVKEIFEKYATGLYTRDELRKQYTKVKGLSKNNFINIFKKPVYCGKIEVPALYDEPKEIVRGLHFPIISEELFNKVQGILIGNTRKMEFNKANIEQYPMKNLFLCSEHNRMITASGSRSRNGSIHHYYHCSHSSCKNRIPKDQLEKYAEELLKSLQVPSEVLDLYHTILEETFKSKQKEFIHDTKDLEKSIEQLKEKISKIDMDFANGDISSIQYTRISSQLSDNLILQENELRCHNDEKVPYTKLLKKGLHLLPNLHQYFSNGDGYVKNKIIGSMFKEKFIIDKGKVRTADWIEIVSGIMLIDNDLANSGNEKASKNTGFSIFAPPLGLEPRTL